MGTPQDFAEEQVSREVGQALKNLCSQRVFHAATAVAVTLDVAALPRHLVQ
jgi:hypothetical protein